MGLTEQRRGWTGPIIAATAVLLVVALAAAAIASSARAASGTLAAWGQDDQGQLGIGTFTGPERCIGGGFCSITPVSVPGLSGVTAIASGNGYSVALLNTGKVMAWGTNNVGQLGDGTNISSATPVEVEGLGEVVAIGVREGGALALLADGTVMAWGSNAHSALGDGSATGPETCSYVYVMPKEVSCATRPVEVSGLTSVRAVSSGGGSTSFAILGDGAVMAWGDGGWLGNGERPGEATGTTPVEIPQLAGARAISTTAGHDLAVTSAGTVVAWGQDERGELGQGTIGPASAVPVSVSGLSGVTSVAAGDYFSLALLSSGKVMAWGTNNGGQLGYGKVAMGSKYQYSDVPVETVDLNHEATAIAAGWASGYALLRSGKAMAWGNNGAGELGDGLNGSLNAWPVEVARLSEVSALAAGGGGSGEPPAEGAVLAIGTAAAGAPPGVEPQIGRCVKVAKGKGRFAKGCAMLEPGSGYEWVPGAVKAGFKTAGGASAFLGSGKTIACAAQSSTGNYEGASDVSGVVLTFTGCKHSTSACSSAGAGSEEIVTSTLDGGFVWGDAKRKVALDLHPAGEIGPFAAFTCGGKSFEVTGSVLAFVTTGRLSGNTLKYELGGGQQHPDFYETATGELVEASLAGLDAEEPGERVALTIKKDSLTNEEPLVEISGVL